MFKLDIFAHKKHLLKAREIGHKIPFFWTVYGGYWRVRTWVESRVAYPISDRVLSFGKFPKPTIETPTSQLCTSNQFLTKTYRDWCDELDSPARYARKQWEFVYILQALKVSGALTAGKLGLGFGCGREPLPGLFAKSGCTVLATDLAQDEAKDKGWVDTSQHSSTMDELYIQSQGYLSREVFDQHISFEPADMNSIPERLYNTYDFVWSACALEHLGSLRHGIDFIKNSAKCLKAGGVAVHTTEFNLSSNDLTCEEPGCSIYREQDMQQLVLELEQEGYEVEPLNLNVGERAVDNHIDAPPYGLSPHLKLELSGHVVTSIGIIVKRKL